MKNKMGHVAYQENEKYFSISENRNLRITRDELDKLIALEGGTWFVFVDSQRIDRQKVSPLIL